MNKEQYAERQENKLRHYQDAAIKAEAKSNSYFDRSNKIMDVIPFGQPILVGHHSERHHRNDLARADKCLSNAIDEKKKAEHYQEKVENILNPQSISSDDPEAVQKLKAKLEGLLKYREQLKKQPHEAYQLSNLAGNIRSVKLRIEQLQSQQKRQNKEYLIDAVRVVENADENRLQLFFPGKPEESVRDKLKQNGFRWSPYNGCWQRHLNNAALYALECVLPKSLNNINNTIGDTQ